ncbi:MAG: glycerol-3-phosphate dehydrogenase [Phycisphaerae bacterium]|nr:glycerol-3-phosphate dehydrogenase [Phycisphaerae bacterium]
MIRNFEQLADGPFDLLIVGGGINGAGAARDAALRGLRTALVDKGDFACGTSSASSKLVHGGLRYLEQAQIALVRESLAERGVLLSIAPHAVRPMQFDVPILRGQRRGPLAMRVGLAIYDILAGRHRIGRRALLSADELLEHYGDLHRERLRCGVSYWDAWMDDARLCLLNVIDAAAKGAAVCNYARVSRIVKEGNGRFAVDVEDVPTGRSARCFARSVLNTTGPWSDRFLGGAVGKDVRRLALSKGVHLVFSRPAAARAALMLAGDGRVFFMIPWYGYTMVGTTDTPFDGDPDQVQPTEQDVDYLLDSISGYFGRRSDWETQLVASFAGLRPLLAGTAGSTYRASREHLLAEDAPGLFSLVGGKYTTYRRMAAQAVDAVGRFLDHRAPCRTAELPLPGGHIEDFESWSKATDAALAANVGDAAMREYLMRTLGSEAIGWVERYRDRPDMLERIDPRHPVPRAMIDHARRCEMAVTDEDILRRRTPLELLGYRGPLPA